MEKLVMENIFSSERESRIIGANELSSLNSKQRHKLVERGVIQPLVSMLHSQDYEAIEASLFALLSLAFGSERSKSRIAKFGAIPAITNLLGSGNESLIELASASMLILSSCKSNKLQIASSNLVIQTLIHLLNDDENENGQTKLDTIATLHSLSTCREAVPFLVSSGTVIPSLLRLLGSPENSPELSSKAAALLEDLVAVSHEALQETAGSTGAIRSLVEAVEGGSDQCREHAARVLLFICKSCRETYRDSILGEGVIPGLLQLSVDGTWRAKSTAAELLFLLRDTCPGFNGSRNEVIEEIMQEIDAEEGRVVDATTLRLVQKMIARLST